MNKQRQICALEDLGACDDAQEWIADHGGDVQQMWEECPHLDWMCWLLVRVDLANCWKLIEILIDTMYGHIKAAADNDTLAAWDLYVSEMRRIVSTMTPLPTRPPWQGRCNLASTLARHLYAAVNAAVAAANRQPANYEDSLRLVTAVDFSVEIAVFHSVWMDGEDAGDGAPAGVLSPVDAVRRAFPSPPELAEGD